MGVKTILSMIPFAWALCYSDKDRLDHRDYEYETFAMPSTVEQMSDADRALMNARRPYYSFVAGVDETRPEANWLSERSLELWMRAAEVEWRLGREGSATDLLGLVLIFGTESQRDRGNQHIETWSREAGGPRQPSPRINADALVEAARLYAQMNVHPRAITLLEAHADVLPEEHRSLAQRYRQEWLALLGRYCTGTVEHCVVFGQDVFQAASRDKVVVPAPSAAEALAAIAEELKR